MVRHRPALSLLSAVCALGHASASDGPTPGRTIEFARDVRPILASNCFACHGPDEKTRQAGLRLDTHEGALEVVRPGNADASSLIRHVLSDDPSERMPPPEVSERGLSDQQFGILRAWINEGVSWGEHWSFLPPVSQPPPAVSSPDWVRRDLDALVLAALDDAGLPASASADRRTLARRVSLDLTGLPPDPARVDAFVSDPRPDAYEQLVDELLASPHYGEKWARWWLDLARYADTKGYEKDERRTMWPYRDWVVRALNDDMPMDRFAALQLAGDMLPDASESDLVATAFHRNTMTNDEGGTDDEEFRTAAVIDRVNTTMEIWQGLTMACAQCHTHKFEPITHTDYFRVFAIFNNTEDADRYPVESPVLPLPSKEQQERIEALKAEIARLEAAAASEPAIAPELEPKLAEARGSLGTVQSAVPELPIMRELAGDQRRVTRVFTGGSYLNPADEVSPGVPDRFARVSESHPANRAELAAWLFDPDNPLTGRTLANRVWEQVWGIGIVETVEDLGTQGAWPSNQPLLDHLAIRFMEGNWSLKRLLREIVTSSTYMQSSDVSPQLLERDPANRLLARGPRTRLDAETIRDQALAASGLLSRRMYGPSVFPYQPPGLWIMIYSGDQWATSPGEDKHRRSLYTFIRRTVPHPAMTTFDAPSREVCVSRRLRTNTPLQAMVTLNDPQFVECAQALARVALASPGDDAARLSLAMRRVLARPPSPDEQGMLLDALRELRSRFDAAPEDALPAATDPIGPLPEGVDAREAAPWTVLCSVILNLDEALTKE